MAGSKSKAKSIIWPATCLQLEAAGYRLMKVRPCRLCGASLEFWRTPRSSRESPGDQELSRVNTGKFMPMDRGPNGMRSPHWSTCPEADKFRQNAKQGDLFT